MADKSTFQLPNKTFRFLTLREQNKKISQGHPFSKKIKSSNAPGILSFQVLEKSLGKPLPSPPPPRIKSHESWSYSVASHPGSISPALYWKISQYDGYSEMQPKHASLRPSSYESVT